MEYVAGASGAVLGFIEGDVPGAYTGYQLGKRAYNFFTKKNSMPPAATRRRNSVTLPRTQKRVGQYTAPKRKPNRLNPKNRKRVKTVKKKYSKGVNMGKFKKPVKVAKSFEATSLKNGYHLTKELYGQVDDTDCVNIWHSNFIAFQAAKVLTGALLRSLFRKAGIEIGNQEQEIPLLSTISSAGFRIGYTNRNPVDAALTTDYYPIVENSAFWSVVDGHMAAGRMGNQFLQYMLDVAENWKEPYTLGLYSGTGVDSGTDTRLHALITLQDEFIVYQAMSTLTVQNRTAGSSAVNADFNADRIDNQPIKGYLYEFKNGDPRLKTSMGSNTGIAWNRDFLYNTGDLEGIRTFRGSNLPTIGSKLMAEPVQATIWKNIHASSKVFLEPGHMKKATIVSMYKHRLAEMLKKFRIDVSGVPVGVNPGTCYSKLSSHKSQLVSLEEVLHTPSTNLVTCLWEAENKVGAYTYTQKLKGVLKSEYSTAEVAQYA